MRGCKLAGEHIKKCMVGSGGGLTLRQQSTPQLGGEILINYHRSAETLTIKFFFNLG